jgi:hypothetical protein
MVIGEVLDISAISGSYPSRAWDGNGVPKQELGNELTWCISILDG